MKLLLISQSKGKNFRANHNHMEVKINSDDAVAYIAKVRILEQITTNSTTFDFGGVLLLISQR